MYYPDRFQKPNPFQPDVAVCIDSAIDKKLDALDALVSQFDEGGANGPSRVGCHVWIISSQPDCFMARVMNLAQMSRSLRVFLFIWPVCR